MPRLRPEYSLPPEIYYNEEEAKKYITCSRYRQIQSEMTERALELLLLPDEPCLLLDVGCGSGLSGSVLSEKGHFWIGIDISIHMLKVGIQNDAQEGGDMIMADMGKTMRFQEIVFDGMISISALQWLCNWDRTEANPRKRMHTFFRWLYLCLKRGARAVFQFYPDSPQQIQMLTECAMKSGFGGGVVVDFPNSTKSKKYYLCIWAGSSVIKNVPKMNMLKQEQEQEEETIRRDTRKNKKTKKKIQKRKDYVIRKKEKKRKGGMDVPKDSKYTGRIRRPKF